MPDTRDNRETPRPAAASEAEPSSMRRWGYGVLLTAAPVAIAASAILAGKARLPGYRGGSGNTIYGIPAVAVAIAHIGFGLYLHFRFFWGDRHATWRIARMGKIISLLLVIGGFAWAAVAMWISNWS